ncbi:MAG TPA: hypothetical protein VMW48_02965, partial [Vicinamibacterales bacterium]|nr:hypothetical protein [Vicinamibacterales bacterium]
LVTVAAIAMRLLLPIVWNERAAVGSAFYLGDARAFSAFASAIVAGQPFDNGVPFHPPGWPYLLAAFYAVAGYDPAAGSPANPAAVKAFVAVVSGLASGVAALLARVVGGRTALVVVAPIAVFHFGHAVQGTVVNSEALYGLLLAGLLTVLVLAPRNAWLDLPARGAAAFAAAFAMGAMAGLTAVVRAEFLLGCALIALALARVVPRVSRVTVLAAYLAGVGAALTPSTIAHWHSIGDFNTRNAARLAAPLPRLAPVTSYGAFSFAMANHADADGGPNSDHPLIVPASQEEAERLDAGQLDLSVASVHRLYTDGYRIGVAWWLAHPGDALRLLGRKTRIAYGALALGYGPLDAPVGVDGIRRRVDVVEPDALWLAPLHLGLLVLGWFVLRRRSPDVAWLFAIPVVTLLASTWLFYGYVRLVVAYLPVLWVLQALALDAVAARSGLKRRLDTHGAALAAGVIVLGLAAVLLAAARPRSVALDGFTDENGQVLVDETVRVTAPPRR